MGNVVPLCVCLSVGLNSPAEYYKGIGYALLMLLVLQLGITVSKGKGEKGVKK